MYSSTGETLLRSKQSSFSGLIAQQALSIHHHGEVAYDLHLWWLAGQASWKKLSLRWALLALCVRLDAKRPRWPTVSAASRRGAFRKPWKFEF